MRNEKGCYGELYTYIMFGIGSWKRCEYFILSRYTTFFPSPGPAATCLLVQRSPNRCGSKNAAIKNDWNKYPSEFFTEQKHVLHIYIIRTRVNRFFSFSRSAYTHTTTSFVPTASTTHGHHTDNRNFARLKILWHEIHIGLINKPPFGSNRKSLKRL